MEQRVEAPNQAADPVVAESGEVPGFDPQLQQGPGMAGLQSAWQGPWDEGLLGGPPAVWPGVLPDPGTQMPIMQVDDMGLLWDLNAAGGIPELPGFDAQSAWQGPWDEGLLGGPPAVWPGVPPDPATQMPIMQVDNMEPPGLGVMQLQQSDVNMQWASGFQDFDAMAQQVPQPWPGQSAAAMGEPARDVWPSQDVAGHHTPANAVSVSQASLHALLPQRAAVGQFLGTIPLPHRRALEAPLPTQSGWRQPNPGSALQPLASTSPRAVGTNSEPLRGGLGGTKRHGNFDVPGGKRHDRGDIKRDPKINSPALDARQQGWLDAALRAVPRRDAKGKDLRGSDLNHARDLKAHTPDLGLPALAKGSGAQESDIKKDPKINPPALDEQQQGWLDAALRAVPRRDDTGKDLRGSDLNHARALKEHTPDLGLPALAKGSGAQEGNIKKAAEKWPTSVVQADLLQPVPEQIGQSLQAPLRPLVQLQHWNDVRQRGWNAGDRFRVMIDGVQAVFEVARHRQQGDDLVRQDFRLIVRGG